MTYPKASDLFQFTWQVAIPGYSWVKARPVDLTTGATVKHGQYLCAKSAVGGRQGETSYDPRATVSGLFKTFAMTDPKPAPMATFANKYGQLGAGVGQTVVIEGGSTLCWGESLAAWTLAISRMRRAIELWDAIEAQDIRTLERRIKWEKGGVLYYSHPRRGNKIPPGSQVIAISTEVVNPGLLDRFLPNDVVEPARFALQQIVNRELKDSVSPRILFDGAELGFFQTPDGLRAAMWLQFAQAIGGKKKIIKCSQCNTWFQVAPGVGRQGKKYCTDACRAAAHRKKRSKK